MNVPAKADAAPLRAPSGNPLSARYLLSLLAGIVVTGACFLLGLVGLELTGNLPPPAFTNELCKDEKINFLRERAPPAPDLLALGSSVALFNFSGEPIYELSAGETVPVNAGLCMLRMGEIATAGSYFINRYPSASSVALIVSPHDFFGCAGEKWVADTHDVDRYVYEKAFKYIYYFKYFSPTSFFRNIRVVAQRRAGVGGVDAPVAFDRFGSYPSAIERDLYYYGQIPTEPRCFERLRAFAAGLPPRIEPAITVISPLHPAWVALYDHDGRSMQAFTAAVRNALSGTRMGVLDAHAQLRLEGDHFSDAIHMKRRGADLLSRELGVWLQQAGSEMSAVR